MSAVTPISFGTGAARRGGRGRAVLAGAAAVLALGVLLAVVFGMNRGVVLSSDVRSAVWPWAPSFPEKHVQTPALSDPVWQFVPWLSFARRELLRGRLPLWNPHQDGGVPLLGNGQSALGSPLVWPVLLLDVDPGWNLSLLLRLLLAAGGAFLWLRDVGRSRPAAVLGALAFALSGAFVAWLEHPLALSAAAAPLLLLFVRRAARGGSGGSVAGVALSTYLVLSGGHPETYFMAALLAAASLLGIRPASRGVFAAASGALLGAGLAAPFLLPFAEYFRLSAARLGQGRRPFVLPIRDAVRLAVPSLSGSNVIESAALVSVPLLLLVPAGLAAARGDREARFWAIAAAAMLLAVYDNPVSRLLAVRTPIYWTRALLFLPLALGAVAAAGLDRLRARKTARAGPILAAAVWTFPGAALVQLLAGAAGVHGVTPGRATVPGTPLVERLASSPGPFRVLPLHTFLPPNSATDFELDDVRGYDALAPAAWRASRERIGRFRDLPTQRDVLEPWDLAAGGEALDAWNVEYLILAPRFAFGAETFRSRLGLDLEEVYSGPDGRLFRNRRVRPRVRLDGPGDVRILERRPGRWRLETLVTGAPARLTVADPFFPGWTASVDGVRAPLDPEPGRPMSLDVKAGRHVVDLSYLPESFEAGLAAMAVSAAAILTLLGRAFRRRS